MKKGQFCFSSLMFDDPNSREGKSGQKRRCIWRGGRINYSSIIYAISPFLLSILPRHSLILSAFSLFARKSRQKFRKESTKNFFYLIVHSIFHRLQTALPFAFACLLNLKPLFHSITSEFKYISSDFISLKTLLSNCLSYSIYFPLFHHPFPNRPDLPTTNIHTYVYISNYYILHIAQSQIAFTQNNLCLILLHLLITRFFAPTLHTLLPFLLSYRIRTYLFHSSPLHYEFTN
jgi:hypothetical protein